MRHFSLAAVLLGTLLVHVAMAAEVDQLAIQLSSRFGQTPSTSTLTFTAGKPGYFFITGRFNDLVTVRAGTMSFTKDIRALLRHFAGLAHTVVATPFVGEHKCWPPEDVVVMAKAEGFPATAAAESVEHALTLLAARHFDQPPRILIAGSLFLAAHVLAANGSRID